jgi:hypothetical protein
VVSVNSYGLSDHPVTLFPGYIVESVSFVFRISQCGDRNQAIVGGAGKASFFLGTYVQIPVVFDSRVGLVKIEKYVEGGCKGRKCHDGVTDNKKITI